MGKVSNFFLGIALMAITSCSKSPAVMNQPENSKPAVTLEAKTATLVVKPTQTQLSINTSKPKTPTVLEATKMVYQLTSPVFEHKQAIPEKYTCKGKNISPELTWNNPPQGTAAYGLIVDDPDAPAGTWVHWVIYNIPGSLQGLPESVPKDKEIINIGINGINSSNKYGYSGPCPPFGTHRYFFRLYALDQILDIKQGANKPELIKAMQGHILAIAELMGTFTK
jgi:Raf kinase inhibitor-like YbhB/YbcL family protein